MPRCSKKVRLGLLSSIGCWPRAAAAAAVAGWVGGLVPAARAVVWGDKPACPSLPLRPPLLPLLLLLTPPRPAGEKLSRKNGELEAGNRKLRSALREAEADRDRARAKLAKAEAALAQVGDC